MRRNSLKITVLATLASLVPAAQALADGTWAADEAAARERSHRTAPQPHVAQESSCRSPSPAPVSDA